MDIVFSVKWVREEKFEYVGVIVSMLVVELYELEVLVVGIEINKKNYICFLVLWKEEEVKNLDGVNKVLLCFFIGYEFGSFYKVLVVLVVYNVNLIKI